MMWTIGIGLLAASTVACGGGGENSSGSTSTAAATAEVSGMVNQGEIGGTELSVLSAQQAGSSQVQSGTFTTAVSTQGPQLLFLQDSGGMVRGLTLSSPSSQGLPSVMKVDARSTALALLFLSPGVTTSNVTEARQVLAALQQMNSFGPFLTFLQANLSIHSLDELVKNATYQSLLTDCLTEWPGVAATLPPISAASSSQLAFAVPAKVTPPANGASPQVAGVNITADLNAKSAADVSVTIRNYGWRYIKVLKVPYNSSGLPLAAMPRPDMKGATKLSIGGVFGGTGSPALDIDRADFSNGEQKFEYWVAGPGLGSCPDCNSLPVQATLTSADNRRLWGLTIFDYMLLEACSVISGFPVGSLGSRFISDVLASTGFQDSVSTLMDPTSSPQVALSALVDGGLAILQVLVQNGHLTSPGWLSILNPFNKIFGVINSSTAMGYVATMPAVAKVEISAPYDTIQFERSAYSVKKTDRERKIIVTRIDGEHEDAARIKYKIEGGDAVAGQDYVDKTFPTPGELLFVRGQKTAEIALDIVNNPANTSSRQTTLELLDGTEETKIEGPGKLGTQSTATLTIEAKFDFDIVGTWNAVPPLGPIYTSSQWIFYADGNMTSESYGRDAEGTIQQLERPVLGPYTWRIVDNRLFILTNGVIAVPDAPGAPVVWAEDHWEIRATFTYRRGV